MEFGNRLKMIRAERHLTQVELASLANISQSNINTWETNRSLPLADSLIKLADALSCSTDYLLGREDESGAIILSKNASVPEKKSDIQRIFDRLPPFYQNRVLGYAQGILESIGA